MNTEKLLSLIDSLDTTIKNQTEFLTIVKTLDAQHKRTLVSFLNIAAAPESQSLWNKTQAFKTGATNETQTILRQVKFSTLTKSAQKIENELSRIDISIFTRALEAVEALIEAIDHHLNSSEFSTSLKLAAAAHNLNNIFKEIQAFRDTLTQTIAINFYTDTPESQSIKLYFPGPMSLENFSTKTLALNHLIDECCQLVGLSTSEAGVEINKIESGSFFAKISANPIVIILLTAIITNGTSLIFNQANEASQVAIMKESSDTIEKLLKIRDTLVANGQSVDKLDENLKKSTIIISKHLQKFLSNSSELEINETVLKSHPQNRLNNVNLAAIENSQPDTTPPKN